MSSAAPELEEIEQPTFVERGKYFGPLEVVDGAYYYCIVYTLDLRREAAER